MDASLAQYSLVEVAKLLHPTEQYDGWRLNKRPPAVGDRGTIVEILHVSGRTVYVVEASGPDGVTVWLGDFDREELRPIGDAG